MAKKASIKEKEPPSYNDECNNSAYKGIEQQIASLQMELREMALDKDAALAAADQQNKIKELIKRMRKFLLSAQNQSNDICRMCGKKTTKSQSTQIYKGILPQE